MRFLNTILLVLILIVASGAAYYYFDSDSRRPARAEAAEATQPVYAAPIFLALEPFTATIQGSRSSQILYTEITLRLPDIKSHATLVQYMPEVRNRALAELAQHSAPDLQTTEGRTFLTQRLKTVISAPYHPHAKGPDISSVLFTAFVIQ